MTKYVLTGATGNLGSRVLKHMLNIVKDTDEIVVSLYNPSGAGPFITDLSRQSKITVRQGDFAKSDSLRDVFRGADKLLIVSYPSMAHQIRVDRHLAAIDAAIAANREEGAGRKLHLYYTSLAFQVEDAEKEPHSQEVFKPEVMKAHLDTEAHLKKVAEENSNFTYTSIREGIYNESYPLYFGYFDPSEGKDDVVVPLPYGDGGIAFACWEDLAEGTAKIMTADSGYENKTVTLTGAEAVTLSEIAEQISSILPGNRHLTVKAVDLEHFVTSKQTASRDEDLLRKWSTTYTAIGLKQLAKVNPLLEELLGRKPKPLDETLREMLGVGGSGGAEETSRYSRTTA
ncbi:hypothetical protein EIP91_009520 [Steccherinum ochraceum]|uniref:NmrA-like domain-containing protein n=1 Tax=Steccherinum ochraceum TaxID=92696 RepID=A0A4R0R1K5_9APHY|nr:hypothetical protein EIP91_009520 [Steccherinum ochraceum]